MLRWLVTLLAFIIILNGDLFAHAGLRFSSPIDGVALGDTPSDVQLTMGEKPEPSLSVIHVVDTSGATYDVGRPAAVPGDPLTLSVAVRPLGTGVYTVNWRVVSAVDGHATTGAYAFGVRASPAGFAASNASPRLSRLEFVARSILIVGLVILLGAACADVARFGGPSDLRLANAGWALSTLGLLLLATAQWRNSTTSLGHLLNTSVGQALISRTVAIGAAGAALAVAFWSARSARPRIRLVAMTFGALSTLAAMAVHVAAGHAAAGRWHPATTILIQWAHFAASGIWLGGLAALVLGVRGGASAIKAASVRRFSTIAGVGILVVAASGVWRAVNELASWNDLSATAYGRAVLAKGALLIVIAALGALNRWSSLPAAETDLRPLRRLASGELVLAGGALLAAAMLGTLPPPAAGQLLPGITASAADFATTVRVSLSAASDQPGPNRFVVRIVDYDSKKPVRADRVSLRFTPLDDPGVLATSLALAPGPDDTYVGSGANLTFDGRWRVTTSIEHARTSVEVPLDVETRGVPQFISLEHNPGQAPEYTVEVRRGAGLIRISPHPEHAGPSKVYVTSFDVIGDVRPLAEIVVTAASAHSPVRQQPVQRVDGDRFVADIDLEQGHNRITVVARTLDGTRLRAAVNLDVKNR